MYLKIKFWLLETFKKHPIYCSCLGELFCSEAPDVFNEAQNFQFFEWTYPLNKNILN